MSDCLVLNSDMRPLSYLPLSALVWQDAIKALWLGNVRVLHHYEDWFVRSPSVTIRVPSVLVLRAYVPMSWRTRFTSRHVFLRDEHTCQYCGGGFPPGQLTLDHVTPRSHGGRTSWTNVTTACSPCNLRRGNDIRVRPEREPHRPSHGELVRKRQQQHLAVPHADWLHYVGWEPEKASVRRCSAA